MDLAVQQMIQALQTTKLGPMYQNTPPQAGATESAIAGTNINPYGWEMLLEATRPSPNIEDQRNPKEVMSEALWSRIGNKRDKMLTPTERKLIFLPSDFSPSTFNERWPNQILGRKE